MVLCEGICVLLWFPRFQPSNWRHFIFSSWFFLDFLFGLQKWTDYKCNLHTASHSLNEWHWPTSFQCNWSGFVKSQLPNIDFSVHQNDQFNDLLKYCFCWYCKLITLIAVYSCQKHIVYKTWIRQTTVCIRELLEHFSAAYSLTQSIKVVVCLWRRTALLRPTGKRFRWP
jgi:hypothetical protein